MNDFELPSLTYQLPDEFGCSACGGNFWGLDASQPKEARVPVAQRLGRATLPWASHFYACSQCDTLWAMAFDPRDQMWCSYQTPNGMARALLPEANLNEILPLLFAQNPVGLYVEEALWEIHYHPQLLWDYLVDLWRHPAPSPAMKARALGILEKLLMPTNGFHQAKLNNQGGLLRDLRGFDRELEILVTTMAKDRSHWLWPHRNADDPLPALRALIKDHGLVHKERPAPAASSNKVPPEPVTEPVGTRGSELQQAPNITWQPVAIRDLLLPYWRYFPAIFIGWMTVEVIGANSHPIAQAFFLCFTMIVMGITAAHNAGISNAGPGRMLWHRLGTLGDYLMVGLMIVLAYFAYVVVAHQFDPGLQHPAHSLGLIFSAALVLSRFWPFLIIPFLQPIESDTPCPRSVAIPRRAALSTAWRLTSGSRFFVSRTLPWLLITGAGAALLYWCTLYWGDTARALLLYPVILPGLTAITWVLAEDRFIAQEEQHHAMPI